MIRNIQKKLRNKKGFTLIELIVVMAILGIIAAIAIPNFTGLQQQSRIKADYATASQIVKAARLQEINTGNPVAATTTGTAKTALENLSDEYFPAGNGRTPQSGPTFTLSKSSDKYVVEWTPTGNTGKQTYTEDSSDFTID